MAGAAVGRLEKLLTLCDFQLNAMMKKAETPNALPTREILALGRMILNLQKDLEKYAAIVYPAIEMVSPVATDVKNPVLKSNPNPGSEIKALSNEEAPAPQVALADDNQDFKALLQVGALLADSISAQTPSTKKQSKKDKFAHAFFQKRHQIATQ